MDPHDSAARVYDDAGLRSGVEPVGDLLIHLRVAVARRHDLDHQIRGARKVARRVPHRFGPFASDESRVRGPNVVWVGRQLEARPRRVHPTPSPFAFT